MTALVSFISAVAAWIVLYFDSFPALIRRWSNDDYSYCWLVVPLAIYVAWQRRDMLPKVAKPSLKTGYLALLGVVVFFFLGKIASIDALVFVSMWLSVVVLVLFAFGLRSMKALFFPLLVLAFAVPPPPFINRMLTFKLRLLSSDFSVRMMQFIDIPVYREGNVIDLGMIKLHVVDACSGLRFLFPTILLGILIGYWFSNRGWQRFIVFLATVPTAIVTNALRIAIVGYIARNVSVETAENFFHDASGMVIYLLSIALLVMLSLILNLFGSKESVRYSESSSELYSKAKSSPALHIFIMAILLGSVFILNGKFLSTRIIPERTNFDNFPMQFGEFKGERQYFDDKILESLGADDYLSGFFVDRKSDRKIFVLASYYNYQEPQRAAHNPVSCLLGGGGWDLSSSKDLLADPAAGRKFKMRRLILEKPDARLLALYWFQQRGRIMTDEYLNKVYLALDAVQKHRTDGALVRLEILLNKDETVEHAQKVMNSFISNFSMILDPYIPN
ncbi:MAG: VPLPA-CTERM-specific exosortase XrtD [Desulfovibrio sp. S3730MH75]|nr:MAG: VPLPA-CTERM-specific exosortase XrtD [Desulfovibrio sp. S3730MH75]